MNQLINFRKNRKIIVFLIIAIVFLLILRIGDNEEKKLVLKQTHTFIHNAYYYPKSKSLGDNALALVMAMDKRTAPDITKYVMHVIGSDSEGKEHRSEMKLTVEVVQNARCDYQMTLGQSNTIKNLRHLEIESNNTRVQIPFKKPRETAPKPVIFCISPQFVAEQWQAFIAQVHISHHYGAHLHIYIVSILESYYNLMKEYEQRGYLTIDQWLNIKFENTLESYLEPNRNVELRNQAAAQTDCLLQYKEAAEYIAFLDMDDIIIPTWKSNYLAEFQLEFQDNPLISNIYYEKYDFEVEKVSTFNNQTISSIVRSAVKLNSKDLGKSVVRPEYYNSTWIHYSMNAHTPENKRWTRGVENGVFHLKRMIMTQPKSTNHLPVPRALTRESNLISEKDLLIIDEDLEKLRHDPVFQETSKHLPIDDFYQPIVLACYNRSFYNRRDAGQLDTTKLCINAYDCELPQKPDLKCLHSDAVYKSGPPMFPITFHFASLPKFSKNIGCYQ